MNQVSDRRDLSRSTPLLADRLGGPGGESPEAEAIRADPCGGLPARISDIVKPWIARSPERLAVADNERGWTFGELGSAIDHARGWLVEHGIRTGDRVMILTENCVALLALMMAAAELDAWIVLVGARLAAGEIRHVSEHSGARRVFYLTGLSAAARRHAFTNDAVIETVGVLGAIGSGPLNERAVPEPAATDSAEQVAALIYTSGTSGNPKGVMLTHRNLLYMARISGVLRAVTPDDRVYGVLPISHIVGLSVVALGTLFHGATLHLSARFDPPEILAALQRDRLTVMLGVPAMFALLTEYATLKRIDRADNQLRVISASGAPLDAATKLAAEQLLGLPLHQGYGITECSPTVSQARLGQPSDDQSAGRLLPGQEVRVVDSTGQEVAAGDVGELWVRGPNVMKGYYRAADETAAVINRDGWFNTRDLVRLEGDRLYIVGRTKELIIRFGFNVFPPEVEAVLNAHPAVTISAVVGHAVGGEEDVVAFIQPVPGSKVTADELGLYAGASLAPYKRPSRYVLLPTLPASATGKILKSKLIEMLD